MDKYIVNKINKTAFELAENSCYKVLETSLLKENDRNLLRIYLYSDNGIKIDECTQFARIISKFIDEEEMDEKFYLEVSSPGLDYRLKTKEHYKIFSGKKVKVKLIKPVNDFKTGIGTIEYIDENKITFNISSHLITTEFENIRKCKLYTDVNFKRGGKK